MEIQTEVGIGDISEECRQSARAFLAAAEALVASMRAGQFPSDVRHGNPALWLAFHASELFCKACILKARPGASVNGHSLEKLLEQLNCVAPTVQFKPPFEAEVLPQSSSSDRLRAASYNVIHERLRYPMDKKGSPWKGMRVFSVEGLESDLSDLRQQMDSASQQMLKDCSQNQESAN